jgi:hypothetical protein
MAHSSADTIGNNSYLQSAICSFSNFSVKNFLEKECDNGKPINPNSFMVIVERWRQPTF